MRGRSRGGDKKAGKVLEKIYRRAVRNAGVFRVLIVFRASGLTSSGSW